MANHLPPFAFSTLIYHPSRVIERYYAFQSSRGSFWCPWYCLYSGYWERSDSESKIIPLLYLCLNEQSAESHLILYIECKQTIKHTHNHIEREKKMKMKMLLPVFLKCLQLNHEVHQHRIQAQLRIFFLSRNFLFLTDVAVDLWLGKNLLLLLDLHIWIDFIFPYIRLNLCLMLLLAYIIVLKTFSNPTLLDNFLCKFYLSFTVL